MPEYADIDEMVFEGRERLFGGYVLRKAYPWTLLLSTGLICGLFLIPAFGYLLGVRMGLIENVPVVRNEIALFEGKLPAINSNTREVVVVKDLYRVPEPEIWSHCGYYCWLDSYRADMLSDIQQPEFYASIRLDSPITHSLHFDPNQIPSFLEEIEGESEVPEVVVDYDVNVSCFIPHPEEPVPLNLDEVKELIASEGLPETTRDYFDGMVVARILIDKDGRYRRHTIVKNSAPFFYLDAVEKHLHLLKFTPAIQGGRPIKFWVNVPFRFQLR